MVRILVAQRPISSLWVDTCCDNAPNPCWRWLFPVELSAILDRRFILLWGQTRLNRLGIFKTKYLVYYPLQTLSDANSYQYPMLLLKVHLRNTNRNIYIRIYITFNLLFASISEKVIEIIVYLYMSGQNYSLTLCRINNYTTNELLTYTISSTQPYTF